MSQSPTSERRCYLINEDQMLAIQDLQTAAQLLSAALPARYLMTPKGDLRDIQARVGNILLEMNTSNLVPVAVEAMFACERAVTALLACDKEDAARDLIQTRDKIGGALPPLPDPPGWRIQMSDLPGPGGRR